MTPVDPNSPIGKAIKTGEYVTPDDGVVIVWWKSKKFIAYMAGGFMWKVVLLTSLAIIAKYADGQMSGSWLTFLSFVVVTAGAAQMGFLGGQAWIDRYTSAIRVPGEMGKAVVGGVVDAFSDDDNKPALPAPQPVESDTGYGDSDDAGMFEGPMGDEEVLEDEEKV